MPIGNTPKHETNIAVEYGKSFSFGVWLRDKDDKHLDLTGVKLRFVARKQPRHRGTVVIEKVAIPAHGANWMQHFEFQADDLALPPGEYPYDITLEAKDGYSTPLVKGFVILGANADDNTDNVYPENSGMTTDITVQIRHRDVVKITVERVDGMFKYVQQMIHDFRIYLGNQKDKFDADVKKVVDYYDDLVRLINTNVFVIKEGYHHENPGPGPGTEDIMPGSLYFDLDDDYPLLPGGGGQAIDEGLDHTQAKINALYFDLDDTAPSPGMTQAEADARYALKTAITDFITQANADTRYVNTAGDTMTGSLVLNAAPTLANQAATKQYVDQHTASPLEMYEIYPDAAHLPTTTAGHPELKVGHFVITADDGHLHVCTAITSNVPAWNNIGPATAVVSVLPDGSSMPQDSVLSLDANHLPHWSDIHSQLAARVAAALPTSAAFNPGTTYHPGDVVLYQGKLFQAKTDTNPGQTPDSNPGKWLSLDLGHVAALAAHALTQAEADNLYVPKSQVKIVDTLPAATGLVDDTLIFLVPAVIP